MLRIIRFLVVLLVVAGFVPAARAESFTVRVGVPPPPPRVEVIGVPPSAAHFWVAGHWRWDGHRHVWVGGHWVASRRGHVWLRDHWEHRGGEWIFHRGRWVAAGSGPEVVGVVAPAPPAYKLETVPPPSGPDNFWIAGHWRWEGGTHVWEPGRWETRRSEEVWVPAHWVRQGRDWRYIGGHWRHI